MTSDAPREPSYGDMGKYDIRCSNDECDSMSLMPVEETETRHDEAVARCANCGRTFDLVPRERDEFAAVNDEDVTPVLVEDGTVAVAEVANLWRFEWTRYEIADELDISVGAVQDAILYYKRHEDDLAEQVGALDAPQYADWKARPHLTLLKHENRVQVAIDIVEEYDESTMDHPGEVESVTVADLNARLPNGSYEMVRRALADKLPVWANWLRSNHES